MWMSGFFLPHVQRAIQTGATALLFRYSLPQQCMKRTWLHTTALTTVFTGKDGSPYFAVGNPACGSSHHKLSRFDFVQQWRRYFRTSSVNFSTQAKDSSKGELVYKGDLSRMIKGVKIFSLSTSVIGLCLQPYMFLNNEGLPVALKVVLGGIVNFFIFINPFIIHYIAKKYVTDIHWNRETGVFTAAKLSFFLRRKEIQFTADDVTVPDIPGMFTVLEVKGTPLFIVPQSYLSQEAYIHLMGFNKPMDWELPKQDRDQGRSRN